MKNRIFKILLIFLIGVMSNLNGFSQVISNGTINPSITSQNPFLDASSFFDVLVDPSSSGKGLVFPRVDLGTFYFNTELLGYGTFPSAFDGMIVYNCKIGDTKTDKGNPTTSIHVEPGFYYFYNPSPTTDYNYSIAAGKWLRLTNNLDLVAKTMSVSTSDPMEGMIDGSVYFNPTTGKYRKFNGAIWADFEIGGSAPASGADHTTVVGAVIGDMYYQTDNTVWTYTSGGWKELLTKVYTDGTTLAGDGTSINVLKIKDGGVSNTQVNDNAAILGTKITPSFGTQNISTSGSLILGSGANTITLSAPVTGTGTYTLPSVAPASDGLVLKSTTGGVLSWATDKEGSSTSLPDPAGLSGRYLQSNGTTAEWVAVTPGGGDVSSNTNTSVADEIALFSNGTGKIIKRATVTGMLKATSGVLSQAVSGTDYFVPGSTSLTLGTGNNAVTLTAPTTSTASFSLQLPADKGTSTQVLSSNGSGGLIWSAAGLSSSLTTGAVYVGVAGVATATLKSSIPLSDFAAAATDISLGGHNLTNAGTVTATSFIGNLNGNAGTATKLATGVKINGTNFDGSSDITITAAPSAHELTSHSDIAVTTLATGQLLRYNSSSKWENFTPDYLSSSSSLDATKLTGSIPTGSYGATTIPVTAISLTGADDTKYLRGDGTWGTPGGSGDMLLGTSQVVTALKTYNKSTLAMKGGTTGTGVTTLASAISDGASNTVTFPAGTGTLALTSDQFYLGTTAIPMNSASGSITTLTGVNIGGNAGTATKLATGVKINGTNFDGSSDITITAAPAAHELTSHSDIAVTTLATGQLLRYNSSSKWENFTPDYLSSSSSLDATKLTGSIPTGSYGATTIPVTAISLTGASNTMFLRGDGTWAIPGGSGDMTKAVYDANTNNKVDIAETVSDDAITTAKILNGNVTDAKIAAVSGSKVTGDITGNAANVTGTVAISNGGTGQTTAPLALNALLPAQSSASGKVLQSDGTNASWVTPSGGGIIYYKSATHSNILIGATGSGITTQMVDPGDGFAHKLIVTVPLGITLTYLRVNGDNAFLGKTASDNAFNMYIDINDANVTVSSVDDYRIPVSNYYDRTTSVKLMAPGSTGSLVTFLVLGNTGNVMNYHWSTLGYKTWTVIHQW